MSPEPWLLWTLPILCVDTSHHSPTAEVFDLKYFSRSQRSKLKKFYKLNLFDPPAGWHPAFSFCRTVLPSRGDCCTTMLYSMYTLCTGKLFNGDSIWWLTLELMDILQTYRCNSHGQKIWKLFQAFKYIRMYMQMVLFDCIGSFTMK
jgi:hypothetical protein